MKNKIIFALDVSHGEEALGWCEELASSVGLMKVGLQAYCSLGPAVFDALQDFGFDTMLDLKLHDIPNTVAGAIKAHRNRNIKFLTVHASGGSDMLKAAVDAAEDKTTILAVTALTSLGEEDLRSVYGNPLSGEVALRLAEVAYGVGVRGFVCSPLEVKMLRSYLPDVTLVVPGIRPKGSEVNDQKRVATPGEAIKAGADYLVIGRPIREAAYPLAAIAGIAAEMVEGARPDDWEEYNELP